MEKWKEEVAIYRATKGDAAALEVDLHDEEEPTDEAEAGALDSDISTDSEDNATGDLAGPDTKAPTPPVADASKTPRPSKRQKTQATRQVNGTSNTPVPIAPAVAAHTPVPFPVTNAQRAAQANIPLLSSGAEPPATSPVKDKKDKKKKEKAAPQPIAPAPAAKEPSPDDNKKSKKSGRTTRNTEAEAEPPAVEKEKEPKAKKRDRSKRKSEGTAA
jgi:hypothetical protein